MESSLAVRVMAQQLLLLAQGGMGRRGWRFLANGVVSQHHGQRIAGMARGGDAPSKFRGWRGLKAKLGIESMRVVCRQHKAADCVQRWVA